MPRALILLALCGLLTSSRAIAGEEFLPDLRVEPLADFWIDESPIGGRFLRFTATIANAGPGPFELHGTRQSVDALNMRVEQFIHRSGGGPRALATGSVMEFGGDGHEHWHALGVMAYSLWAVSGAARASSKTGFCFWDGDPSVRSALVARSEEIYHASSCGGPNALSNVMGLSVGWTDSYRSTLAWQWIDISGLPAGRYVVSAQADPLENYAEVARDNNCASAVVDLDRRGARVLATGDECGPPTSATGEESGVTDSVVPVCRALWSTGPTSASTPVRAAIERICHAILPMEG